MDTQALFGLSFLLSLVCWQIVGSRYVWPKLASLPTGTALQPLLLLHAFRFIGLAFLVPGVVSPSLSGAFAEPAAYGDLLAALLALLSWFGVSRAQPWAIPAVWIFNIWGLADLLFALFQGLVAVRVPPGDLGATFFIPTLVVPVLLITHLWVFRLLLRRKP